MNVRVPRKLKALATTRAASRRASELEQAVARHQDNQEPSGFAPVGGFSTTQLARDRWMPHDYRPIVGFRQE